MGRTVDFVRDSTCLAVRSAHGLYLADVSGRAPNVSIDLADVRDLAGVGHEIWVVAGHPPRLHRVTTAGQAVGPVTALAADGERAGLIAVPGATAALWTAPSPTLLTRVDDDVVARALGLAGPVVPCGPTTWLHQADDMLRLVEDAPRADGGRGERWARAVLPPHGRLVAGSPLLDGRSVALEIAVEPLGGRYARGQLLVLDLRDGAVLHRFALNGVTAVRIAAHRGVALLCTGPRELVLVDLRFGRVLRRHDAPGDVADLAIDPTGQHLALRFAADDQIAVVATREFTAIGRTGEPPASIAAEPALDLAPEPAPPAPPAAAPAPDDPGFFHGPPLTSVAYLAPRIQAAIVSAREARGLLAVYERLVASLVRLAITRGWDAGRLAFSDASRFPFHAEVEGLLRRSDGRARDEVADAERDTERAADEVADAERATGARVSPLGALAREFGLTPLAQRILVLIAAPNLWGDFARLYGILGNDHGRPLCDELLLGQLLGVGARDEIARELDRDHPLVRFGLILVGDGRARPFLSLTADPVVVRLLRGHDPDLELDPAVRLVPATCGWHQLLLPSDTKAVIAAGVASPPPPGGGRLVVRGRIGAGRHTLLATLADHAGRRLAVIDAGPFVRDLAARGRDLVRLIRRTAMMGCLPCLDGLENLAASDRVNRELVRDLVREHQGPLALCLTGDAQPPLDPGHHLVELPVLSISERRAAWVQALAAHPLRVPDLTQLATRHSVGPGVMHAVVREVTRAASTARPEADDAGAIDRAVRQHLASRLGETATRVARLATWSRVVLPPDILDSILELIARIKHRRTVYDDWGYDVVMSTSRGVTALFQGGPGTGKTLVAGAIANDLGVDLYRVDVSRIMSKWIGETEQNLARLFDAAEDGQAIILFDEADSLFARRTEVRSSVDRFANLEVNYLLQRLDSFEGIAILTTNFGTSIDPAFRRRLSLRLTFPFPDEEMREELWKSHIPAQVPRQGDLGLEELARRYRLSGGYIRNAALRAAFLAAAEHSPLTKDHLERAIRAEFREIGKLAETGVLE